jgi:hypothetical protein
VKQLAPNLAAGPVATSWLLELMSAIATNARYITASTLAFAMLMLLWSLAGYWRYPDAIVIRSIGSLICVLVFPLSLPPYALLRLKQSRHIWVVVILSLLALGLGLFLAVIGMFVIRELATQFIIVNHLEFTDKVNYIIWPGLTAGFGGASAILLYAICLSYSLWLAFDLYANRVIFWVCLISSVLLGLLVVTSLCLSSV